tara:strand:+ start:359 stop:907 length:549 start_codon:yes stop_codon:yes gene_type:complete
MTDKKDERYDYVVYKLCSDLCSDFYIGSTRNMVQRKRTHKGSCNNQNHIGYNTKKSKTIRDNGGFENWRMVPLELMENTTKFEAECREEVVRCELQAKLNSQKASCGGLTPQEYRKQYYDEHIDHILQNVKKYQKENKEQIREHKLQKIDCPCGCQYTHSNKIRHEKSKKHQNYVNSLEPTP